MTTGSVLAQFTITLSQAVSEQVAVEWHTADGTALAGVDYAAAKGTVLFAPGQTAKTVDILVHGRAVGAEDRSFFVEMLPPTNAILGASIGECIIHVDTTGSTPVTQIIVPTGPQGLQGDSAYQAWLDLGNTGTEEDFINSLKPSAEEIAEEVAPLLDVSNSPLTAEGTETLSKPDTMTGKRLARRVAYVGAAKVATVVLADGDNLITHADLSGDAVDFNSISLYPRILRGTAVISPEWSVEPGDKILIKSAVAGDVLHVCQYDVISGRAVKNVVEPLVSTALAPVSAAVAKAGSQAFEALRRSYAEAGYNVVGVFQGGFTLVNANDVGIDEVTGKGFTGPAGTVAAGTDPASAEFVDVSGQILRRQMGYLDAWGCLPGVLNDVALQNVWDNCEVIRMPEYGEWLWQKIKLRSNRAFIGNKGSILKQVQPSDSSLGGFVKEAGEDLKNVQFIEVVYDGQRKANPTSPYNHMCYIELTGNEVVEDILAYRCDMRNSQEDFINVTSYSNTARGKNIKAVLCKFSTDSDKVSLAGNPVISSGNGLRVWNRSDPNTSYGIPVFTDVGTFGCFGERIRTVSDFKRGVKTFSIANNDTLNCHDCHHSFDGAFDGSVIGNVGRNEPGFSLGSRPNMIEGQGEDVVVSSNEFDGGLVTTAFINITDYGMPGEGNGTTITNVGHRSVNISVIGNFGRNVNQNMYNGINNLNCQWLNNSAKSAGAHGYAQSSGTARNDATTGLPLKASGNKYSGNSEAGVSLPISVRNCTGTMLGSNTDDYGNESLYLGGGDTLLVAASEYAPFKQTSRADNFNPNPQLKLNAAGTGIEDWVCPRAVVVAATKPAGATNAVTINDDSTTANLEHVVNAFYPALQNEVVFISLFIKRNTATSCGVIVQEYDAAGVFIASHFKTLSSTPVNWTKYITRHKVVSANCASLRIGVLPAATFNDPPKTGMTDIALVYIGRTPA